MLNYKELPHWASVADTTHFPTFCFCTTHPALSPSILATCLGVNKVFSKDASFLLLLILRLLKRQEELEGLHDKWKRFPITNPGVGVGWLVHGSPKNTEERKRASGKLEMKTSFKVGVRCFPLMRKGILK